MHRATVGAAMRVAVLMPKSEFSDLMTRMTLRVPSPDALLLVRSSSRSHMTSPAAVSQSIMSVNSPSADSTCSRQSSTPAALGLSNNASPSPHLPSPSFSGDGGLSLHFICPLEVYDSTFLGTKVSAKHLAVFHNNQVHLLPPETDASLPISSLLAITSSSASSSSTAGIRMVTFTFTRVALKHAHGAKLVLTDDRGVSHKLLAPDPHSAQKVLAHSMRYVFEAQKRQQHQQDVADGVGLQSPLPFSPQPMSQLSKSESMLYLNYRFDLLRQHYEDIMLSLVPVSPPPHSPSSSSSSNSSPPISAQPDVDIDSEMRWFQRQIAVLLASVAWHVQVLQTPITLSGSPTPHDAGMSPTSLGSLVTPLEEKASLMPSELMLHLCHMLTQIMQLLQIGLEQRVLPPFLALFGFFESILIDVTDALHEHHQLSDTQMTYPTPMARASFLTLLTFLVYKPQKLPSPSHSDQKDGGNHDGDDTDEDDDDEEIPASLQPEWKLLLTCLLRFPRSFRIGYDTHLFGLLPVFFEVCMDQLRVRDLTMLSALVDASENHNSPVSALSSTRQQEIVESFAAIENTMQKLAAEVESERASSFDLMEGQQTLGMCVSVLESWVCDYHSAEPAVVARVFRVLALCLRSLRVLSLLKQATVGNGLSSPTALSSTSSAADASSSSSSAQHVISPSSASASMMMSPQMSPHDAHISFHALLANPLQSQAVDESVAQRIGLSLYRSSLRQYQRVRMNFFRNGLNADELADFVDRIRDSLHADATEYVTTLTKANIHPCVAQVSILNMLSLLSRDLLMLFYPKYEQSVAPDRFLKLVIPPMLALYAFADRLAPPLYCPPWHTFSSSSSSFLQSSLPSSSSSLPASSIDSTPMPERINQGRALLHQCLPSLTALCTARLRDWIDSHAAQSQQWLPRCLLMDTWQFVEDAKYSTSVVDLFSVLSAQQACFLEFLETNAPAICNEAAVDLFVSLMSEIVTTYTQQVVASVWNEQFLMPPINVKRPEDEGFFTRIKRSLSTAEDSSSESSSSSGGAGFFASVFSSSSSSSSISLPSSSSVPRRSSVSAPPPPAPSYPTEAMDSASKHCKLLQQDLSNLLVKLCNLQAVSERLEQCAQAIETKWSELQQRFNNNHESSTSSSSSSSSSSSAKTYASLALPSVPIASISGVFDGTQSVIKEAIGRMRRFVALRIVWGEWRNVFVHELWIPIEPVDGDADSSNPFAAHSKTHLRYFRLPQHLSRFEDTLESLYQSVGDQLFLPVVRALLAEVSRALAWVLLHGLGVRSFTVEDAEEIRAEMESLREYFGKELSAEQVRQVSKGIDELIELMGTPTEELIERSRSLGHGSGALQTHIAQTLYQRSGDKAAKKFVKRLRALESDSQ